MAAKIDGRIFVGIGPAIAKTRATPAAAWPERRGMRQAAPGTRPAKLLAWFEAAHRNVIEV